METVQARKTRIALTSLFLAVACASLSLQGCGAAPGEEKDLAPPSRSGAQHGDGNGTVSARLGGFDGILAFLENSVVPAELADPEIALPMRGLRQLVEEGVVGGAAAHHVSAMGYQDRRLKDWHGTTAAEIAADLREQGIDGLILAPA